MRIITRDEFKAACVAGGVPEDKVWCLDDNYAMPSEDDVRMLGRNSYDWLVSNGLDVFAAERNDCDKFAVAAWQHTRETHAKGCREKCGIAFGLALIIGNYGGHALNFAIHARDNGELYLCLYEPQIMSNDRNELGRPYIALRELPLSSVALWSLALC